MAVQSESQKVFPISSWTSSHGLPVSCCIVSNGCVIIQFATRHFRASGSVKYISSHVRLLESSKNCNVVGYGPQRLQYLYRPTTWSCPQGFESIGLTADMRIFGSMLVARFSDAFGGAVGKLQQVGCSAPWLASDTMEMRPCRTFEGISASNLATVETLLAQSAMFILSVQNNLQTSWLALQLWDSDTRLSAAGKAMRTTLAGVARLNGCPAGMSCSDLEGCIEASFDQDCFTISAPCVACMASLMLLLTADMAFQSLARNLTPFNDASTASRAASAGTPAPSPQSWTIRLSS